MEEKGEDEKISDVTNDAVQVDKKVEQKFRTLLEYLNHKVGSEPSDAIGWLYVARGCYKIKRYDWCFSALCQPLGPLNDDNDVVRREAQHLMAFSLYKQKQIGEALNQFCKSVKLGNEHDWQMHQWWVYKLCCL